MFKVDDIQRGSSEVMHGEGKQGEGRLLRVRAQEEVGRFSPLSSVFQEWPITWLT